MMWFRRRHKTLGRQGEEIAARALRKAGYCILARNLRLGRCEIDIVAREGDFIAFTEVKTRRASGVFAPEDSVGALKRRHIISAAQSYIARTDDPEQYYRFDIVSVVLPESGKPDVTIHRDAFRL